MSISIVSRCMPSLMSFALIYAEIPLVEEFKDGTRQVKNY